MIWFFNMLPAIIKVTIPLFAESNEKIYYELSDEGIYLENMAGTRIYANNKTEVLKMWRVK